MPRAAGWIGNEVEAGSTWPGSPLVGTRTTTDQPGRRTWGLRNQDYTFRGKSSGDRAVLRYSGFRHSR